VEVANLLTGENLDKLPRYPCAMVSFRSIQDSELSDHGTDVILLASEEIFIQKKSIRKKSKKLLSLQLAASTPL
jgi:hypothetical protein